MSSSPFCLGIPVVDEPPLNGGSFVLRSRDHDEMQKKLKRLRSLYRTNDLIKVYHIGYRPDRPIPTAAYFTEICIEMGIGRIFKPYQTAAWHTSFTGIR